MKNVEEVGTVASPLDLPECEARAANERHWQGG